MKKGLLTLAVMMSVIAFVCAGVVACGHKHSYKWDNDDTNHWQVCSCGDKIEEEEHDYGNDNKCDVCGYEKAEPAEHQHESPLTHYEANESTCTETGNIEYWQCSVCKAYFADEYGSIEVEVYDIMTRSKGHSYESEWDFNDTEHWHNPTCEHKDTIPPKDKAAHRITNGICTCGYSKATEGLALSKSEDGQSYIVTGLGDVTTKSIVIPSVHEGLPVTAIADEAFSYSDITSVAIPGSVKTIGEAAFSNCFDLSTVILGNGITSLGESAFNGTNIKTITIPGSIKAISSGAFGYSALREVTIEEGVESIDEAAFMSSDLTTITIPVSLTSIGEIAFFYCTNLTTIYYNGTQTQWNKINFESDWAEGTGHNYSIVYNANR